MCKRTEVRLAKSRKSCEPQTSILGKMQLCPFSRSILCSELGRGTEKREGHRGRNFFCAEKNMGRRAVWVS